MDKKILDKLEVMQGDITKLEVDAIVNAANKSLLGGGGVDGAIHRAAGPELLEECRTLGGCPTGEARITKGYQLPARHVIHTVGPVYGGKPEDSRLLTNCYENSLKLAVENNVKSIAFPAISCGVYGYPIQEACKIAVDTTCNFLKSKPSMEKAIFILFSAGDYNIYNDYLKSISH
ncbi:MAG: O-acetyl-ADP-ribose deacetylase [Desulfobacterales bacterium]|nr:MAG: O-acetyl-ADP-ribose deacetylase [Desulfobacterales bacterium]